MFDAVVDIFNKIIYNIEKSDAQSWYIFGLMLITWAVVFAIQLYAIYKNPDLYAPRKDKDKWMDYPPQSF